MFKGPPPDIYGTNGNNFLEDGITRIYIYRVNQDGTQAISYSARLFKQATLGGSLAESLDGGYWAWSDDEIYDGLGLYVFYLHDPIPTADGQYRIISTQDSNGGTSYGPPVNYTVDTLAPDTSVDSGPSSITNSSNASFTFSGTDPDPPNGHASGIDYFDCRIDGQPAGWDHCTNPGGSAPYTYNVGGLTEGGHTLEVRALDKASNEDPTPATYSWGVDKTPPDITITNPSNKDRYLLHDGPSPDFSCTDPLKGDPPATPFASGVDTCTATPINDEDFGPHFFEVTATDRAGNTSTKKVAYTIDPPDYGNLIGEDGPLAYYRFNEQLGDQKMVDSSGRGNDGDYKNEVALRRDGATACERRPHPPRSCELAHPVENKAAYFSGEAGDGHGRVDDLAAPTNAYSMEAWVKPRDGQNMMIMGHGGGGQLFIHDGKLAFRQTQDTIYSNAAVPPGEWTHVGATWDGHNTRLYVNGHQVAHSTNANKPPSGTSTFYVGYGEMAPWFHGDMDEAAYYDHALTAHDFDDRYRTGTAFDHPSLERGNSPFNTEGPSVDPDSPKNGGLYAPNKVPHAHFFDHCEDPDDLPGDSDVATCEATVGLVGDPTPDPILEGEDLPQAAGDYEFIVTVTDKGGNVYVHKHSYTVKPFSHIFGHDNPIAYYRLGDGSDQPMVDWSPAGNHYDGEYKNGQDSGPTGISGDNDKARDFFGAGGYGYANNIPAPKFQATLEAWVKPLGNPDPTSTEFSDPALPPGWSQQNVWNPGGSATVSGGRLTVDGASAGTNATYGSGRTLDFKATFNATPFAHAGFGTDYNNPPWAMFSVKGDGRLYARTNNGVDNLETDLGTGYFGADHRYRIDWTATKVVYYVDGDVVASHAISFGPTQLRPLVSDYNTGGGNLTLDWLRMSPHTPRDQSILGHGGNSDAGEIYIKDGHFRFRHMGTEVVSSVPVRFGEWQQVVGTWDGVDIRIYVDGELAGQTEQTKRPSSTNTFYVGYGEMAPWFNGSIDEAVYYGTALPAARVYQHFLADPPPSAAGDAGKPGDSELNGPGSGSTDTGSTGSTGGGTGGSGSGGGETGSGSTGGGSTGGGTSGGTGSGSTGGGSTTTNPPPGAQMSAALGTVKVGKRVVTASYSCGKARACSGKASAVLVLGKARFSLGSKSFSAAAGAKGNLRFKLSKKQRQAAKASSKRAAEVTLTGSDGRVLDRG